MRTKRAIDCSYLWKRVLFCFLPLIKAWADRVLFRARTLYKVSPFRKPRFTIVSYLLITDWIVLNWASTLKFWKRIVFLQRIMRYFSWLHGAFISQLRSYWNQFTPRRVIFRFGYIAPILLYAPTNPVLQLHFNSLETFLDPRKVTTLGED